MITVGVVAPERTRELRRGVLRPELGPGDPLPGDELTGCVHLAATDGGGQVVCTCFVYPEPAPWLPDRTGAWRLRQMATAPERRGQGIGGLVLEASMAYVRDQLATLLWCTARVSAARFYRRHGFRTHGTQFADGRGVPHLQMYLELPG